MELTHWYELIALAIFFGSYIWGIEKLYLWRLRKDREQWELGDSCLRKRVNEYRKNFGIADVRTHRREN